MYIKGLSIAVLANSAGARVCSVRFGFLSVCPSVRLSVCPSVRLSDCPSVRLSTAVVRQGVRWACGSS